MDTAKKFTPISEELKNTISTVFKSFDKDNSGFIDVKEVGLVAKELGQEITEAEVTQIFGEIDTNKDNKISFNEFYEWWCYGKINKMERLVYYKLKALNLMDKTKSLQSRLGNVLSEKYEQQTDSVRFSIRAGPYEPKTKIGLNFSVGKASDKRFELLVEGLDVNKEFTVVIKAAALHDPKAVEASLKKLVKTIKGNPKKDRQGLAEDDELRMFLSLVDFKVRSDDTYVYLVITSKEEFLLGFVEGFAKTPLANLNAEFDSSIGVTLELFNDFKTLLNAHANDKLVLSILEGFNLNFEAFINAALAKNVRKEMLAALDMINGGEGVKKYKNLLVLSLLKTLKLDIELNKLEKKKLEEFFGGIGSNTALKATPTFIELLDLIKKIGVAPLLDKNPIMKEIVLFMRANLKAKIDVFAKVKQVLIGLEFSTSGLKECYDYVIDRNE